MINFKEIEQKLSNAGSFMSPILKLAELQLVISILNAYDNGLGEGDSEPSICICLRNKQKDLEQSIIKSWGK